MPVLRTPEDRFADLPDFPFAPHHHTVEDARLGPLRMHYLDEGRPAGRPVVLLHGEPTWSFMFRHTIAPLAAAGLRVLVPDLVGFGRSDKPDEIKDYSYEGHVEWLTAFLTGLGISDAVLLGHDWGGLLGLRVLTAVPGLAAGYVASNHGYPTGDMPANDALAGWQEFAATTPDFETGAIVARACQRALPPAVVAGYDAPYPDETYQAGARAFPALIPTTPDDPSAQAVRDSRAALAASTLPFLTVYGEQDPIAGPADAMFHQLVPGAAGQPHVRIPDAGHNMPEDAGARLGEIVAAFATALDR
jgi:haloalkane dehalogenase